MSSEEESEAEKSGIKRTVNNSLCVSLTLGLWKMMGNYQLHGLLVIFFLIFFHTRKFMIDFAGCIHILYLQHIVCNITKVKKLISTQE